MLAHFITSNFKVIVDAQKGLMEDFAMVNAVKSKSLNEDQVKSWMRKYGLFQGMKGNVRDKIAETYISFVNNHEESKAAPVLIESEFQLLYSHLHAADGRKWLSATSKLLWCIYPNEVVIYDRFVEGTITVLQYLVPELSKLPRLGVSPKYDSTNNIQAMTEYYMRYYDLVNELFMQNKELISQLKAEHEVEYEYDIRILDKALWMMGNPASKP